MDIFDMVFMLQFLVIVGLFLVALFNVMRVAALFSRATVFLMFVAFFIFYGAGFFVTMLNYSTALFAVLFQFETLLVVIYVGLFLAQLFIFLGRSAQDAIPAYNTRDGRQLRQRRI